ncbi:hypothetical protein HMPREF9120_00514 [Neisseria sp. oral taxon 020 str. F0370]|uniref:NYN domain-containing protein n=1 Tax=unclassified Neisseria TaxID=2623750 RepID=UPI0002A3FC85|nr:MULTISPECIES: NYN domain-containing protein [unclassified Neisseria]ASP16365.1 nuclease [Neisseria sp. KEM232]EKY09193.1 hypothetical protein HMPREF9120_00514 [Neisseria sp. oral taxon 020 str. F0370]
MNHNISDKKLAVLIDADNASAAIVEPLLAEIAKYGIASVKRIYGDWSSGLNKWKEALLPHAIIPIQQFAYTKGKNSTDMAMVIDAMDLLYSGTFDGFCIVSSDSDFTRLASRIRESGLTVYGFGEQKTPEAFRRACDAFIFVENLIPADDKSSTQRPSEKTAADTAALNQLICRAIKETADENGWAQLGAVGSYISKTQPDFDHRSYGYGKFSDLVRAAPTIEFKTGTSPSDLYVRKQSFRRFIRLVQETVEAHADAQGLAALNTTCSRIRLADPDFNPKTLGHKTISQAVRAIHSGWIEIVVQNDKEYLRNLKRMM